MQIEYRVEGALDKILWPEPRQLTERCHGLWRQTCFELFIAHKGASAYWEVNICPNMCWNVYHFTDYRRNMQEEKLASHPVWHIIREADLLTCSCMIACQGFIDDSSVLEVAASSVIQAKGGSFSFWAIEHCGTQPDFHDRRGFRMVLPKVNRG